MSVHAKGTVTFMDADGLQSVLERTTALFENNPQSPASFHELSPDYIAKLSKAIVGIEVEVSSLDHVFKLSQNRDAASYNNIITQLEKGDADAQKISKEMAVRVNQL
jgi:transcriptional regulator